MKTLSYQMGVLTVLIGLTSTSALPAAGDALSTSVTYQRTPLVSRFRQRIDFIKEQTNTAESKGWISSERAAQFREAAAQLDLQEQQKPSSKAEIDNLERSITSVHHNLHLTINGPRPET